ncbi:MAG: glycosyltransferase family 2 protein [Chloroflexi bacterium]|nr:glycosyltransferase family 2 protein [Chloroflexota bacterium]MCL5075304.1 glycosyltransferase family 2 protein [Chloroflexota bacterium]
MKGDNFFVVIPAFNEGERIRPVLAETKKHAPNIIVVDDGSSDETYKAAQECGVITLRHEVNLGKGAALKTGCEAAFSLGARAIILMDSDGQHRPAEIPNFVSTLKDRGVGLVLGSRVIGPGMPLIRAWGNKIDLFLLNLLFGARVTDPLCGFRALTAQAYEKIRWRSTGYAVETEMIVRARLARLPFVEIPVETVYIDKYKGVTILDAYRILLELIKWRFLG